MSKSSLLRRFYIGVAFLYGSGNLWTTLFLWQMLALTHSSLFVAAAAAASAIPVIVVGFMGPAHGFGRRMGVWLVTTGAALGILVFWVAHSPWAVLGVGVWEGWVNAQTIPHAQAWMMAQIKTEDAAKASARFEMASRLGMVAGPLVGGALLTASGVVLAWEAAALLLLAAGGLWWTVVLVEERHGHADIPSRQKDAWRVLRQDGFLMTALGVRAGANLLWPAFTVAIPLLIHSPWHARAIGYGTIRTLWGLSTVVGTWLVIPRLGRHLRIAYFLSWTLTGIAFWRIGLSSHLVAAFIWVIVGAVFSPVVHVALDSHIGTAVVQTRQSSVFAIQRLVMAVVNLAGLFLVVGILRQMSPGVALSQAGLVMAAVSVIGLGLWGVRNFNAMRQSVLSENDGV